MCVPSKHLYFENSGWTLASLFRFLIQCMPERARIGLSFSKASAATPIRYLLLHFEIIVEMLQDVPSVGYLIKV